MKWGIRKYQNPDGTLTAEGKRRYDKASTKTSKHRKNLESYYSKELGMNKTQSRLQADRRIKVEKILLAAAGITVAAAATYAATKAIKNRTDLIIKAGSKLQVIGKNPNKNLDRAFYASFKKSDMLRYRGLYGGGELNGQNKLLQFLKGNPATSDVFKIKLDALDDIKIASRDKSAKAFVDMYKNDRVFRAQVNTSDVGKKIEGMGNWRLKRKGYDLFNQNLVNHEDFMSQETAKKFYDKIKSMGYDGILDMNDMKYSHYNSKAPVILLEKGKKISVSDVKQMSDEALKSNYKKASMKNYAIEAVKNPRTYGIAGIAAGSAASSKANQSKIRSMHASGMSYKDIAEKLDVSESTIQKALNKKK